jgi:type I restriction enzyme M protein
LLLDLGNLKKTKDQVVLAIFTDAQTKLRKPTNLKALTRAIDKLDWFSAREEGLGNLYEGLLEKNAAEKKSGAGQYFTPRPLIDCMVRLMKPQPEEIIQDPAAGTGGFLVAADRYIKDQTDKLYTLKEAQAFFQRNNALVGIELVPDTHRLCLINLMLHGIESIRLRRAYYLTDRTWRHSRRRRTFSTPAISRNRFVDWNLPSKPTQASPSEQRRN